MHRRDAGRGVWGSGVQAGGMLGMLGVASGEVQTKWVQGVLWCHPSFGQSVTVFINAHYGSLRQWKRLVQPGDAGAWNSVISGIAGFHILYPFCFCEDDSRSFSSGFTYLCSLSCSQLGLEREMWS